jgi:hypothetical protein
MKKAKQCSLLMISTVLRQEKAKGSRLSGLNAPDNPFVFTVVNQPFIHVRFAAPLHRRIDG